MSDRWPDRRAVSDTIGFVLVFALITSTVAFAYAGGMPGLRETRDAERVNNAERAFDVFVDNMEDITEDGAPSRATEVKLSDAGLSLGEEVTVNVSAVHATTPAKGFTTEYGLRPVVYETTGPSATAVVYEAGGLVRQDRNGGIVRRGPNLVLTEERVVVPVVVTQAADGDTQSVGGQTTVLVRATHRVTRVAAAEEEGTFSTVHLNVTTPRADAWARFLGDRPGVSCSVPAPPDDDTAYCTIDDVDRVYVTVVEVAVAFE